MEPIDSHPAALKLLPKTGLRPGIQRYHLIVLQMLEVDPHRRIAKIDAIDRIG